MDNYSFFRYLTSIRDCISKTTYPPFLRTYHPSCPPPCSHRASLPCRYRPSACCRHVSLRAWDRPSAPVWERRASSPLREFSFRFPLLYLAFYDFEYKNTAPNGAIKLLSSVRFCTELHKKRLFFCKAFIFAL